MADMYGAVRSNVVKVTDPEAFGRLVTIDFRFGDEIQVWNDGENEVSFGGYEQYPSAIPTQKAHEEGCPGDPECDCYAESEEADQAFADAVRPLLADGQVLQVFAAGHEKLRYVAATEYIVSKDHEKPLVMVYGTQDDGNMDSLRARVAEVNR